MRMALFELPERADVPTAVVLDEAVDLANGFPPTTAVGSSTECWQRLPPRCETDETMAPESRSGPTRSLRDHCCLHRVLRIADAQHPPRLGTAAYDSGLYDQGMWLLSRFRSPFVTTMGRNLFCDHPSFILLVLVPFYWFAPGAWILLVASSGDRARCTRCISTLDKRLGHRGLRSWGCVPLASSGVRSVA